MWHLVFGLLIFISVCRKLTKLSFSEDFLSGQDYFTVSHICSQYFHCNPLNIKKYIMVLDFIFMVSVLLVYLEGF